ncbi:putative flavoprotein involved in K+ transport (plasmid) [Rubrobacter radiotolerans]|uniref:NAD(P)/FAD-dependent oxidoreductase n=1 Tax=Rubrobacter radiotolerans TaxID=42256 RepID=A0A023X772_RUBRA|nr:NAD(P)/FAD-dependent oxidoreductase [Rubrobacter radiotolerans]AHY48292.1 putative flavoprotein involved in K+ transport [Rubrobacter radiotolerans]MDX5895565.1 NAD(P)/FAD-dependent oxidoreductase [Rubrobacter radiotolerans]SMC01489.1 Predicted flavoprotein CzcO associated with the cation diffusion facilitator CzcD [Rubrobacter radiotolerans DSM 5868]
MVGGPVVRERKTPEETTRVRVAVVGAGFSGLSVAHALREAGERDFVVLERAGRVGGVWRENVYPGVACDVPSHLYSLSFAPNPDWARSFSEGEEIQRYLEWVARTRGLLSWIRFGEELLYAGWNDAEERWEIETTTGELAANVLVLCAGPLTEPIYPSVKGLESFRGATLHTSRWNREHDFTGQRVAVVGTGASAVQVVPELQRVAKKLTVFQRTPGWVVARPDRRVSGSERSVLRRFPALTKLYRAKQFLVRDGLNYRMIRRNPLVRRLFQKASRDLLEEQIKDLELRRKLTPNYEIGCKRVLISSDFYPALASENVELVASAVREIREGSLVAADGTEHPADAIVFATGFDTTSPTVYKRVRGREGLTLDQAWSGEPRFHRATAISGFPNLFNVCGPGTGSGHGSMVFKAESQTAYITDALRLMRKQNISTVEVSREAQDRYMRRVGEDLDRTVWARGGCDSWYLDTAGRPSLMWPRTMWGFRRMLSRFDRENYILRYAPAHSKGSPDGDKPQTVPAGVAPTGGEEAHR